jgi:hypothetical protein
MVQHDQVYAPLKGKMVRFHRKPAIAVFGNERRKLMPKKALQSSADSRWDISN